MTARKKETKVFLVKNPFMYYLRVCEGFSILGRICKTLLVLFFLSVTLQNAFAEIEIKKKAVEEYRLKGYDEQQRGNWQEALTYYFKAAELSSGSESAGIHNDMGVVYEQLGFWERAEEHYLRAIKLNRRYLPAYLNLAYFYQDQGDPESAIEYFKARIEGAKPNDPWAIKAKEELEELSKDWPQAKKWFVDREAGELTKELLKQGRRNFTHRSASSSGNEGQAKTLAKTKKQIPNEKGSQVAAVLDQIELGLEKEKVREQSIDAALGEFESEEAVSEPNN